jgi:hypothetical protein
MAKIKVKAKSENKKFISPFKNYWTKQNYYILGAGLLLIILGFILMDQGPWSNPLSLSFSPVVLLIAYIIIFPLSILKNTNKNKTDVSSKN